MKTAIETFNLAQNTMRTLDRQQKETAKSALLRRDRERTSLTMREKFNRLAQAGYRLKYRDIIYTWDSGMGVLITANRQYVFGATMIDFERAIRATYGVSHSVFYK